MKCRSVILLSLMLLMVRAFADDPAVLRKPKQKKHSTNVPVHVEPSRSSMWNDLEQGPLAVVGYLGVYNVGVYPLPFVIGADFRMLLPNNPNVALRAGMLYWTATGWGMNGASASLVDFSAGAGYVWTIKRVEIEAGGRLGYDLFTVSSDFNGWDVFGKSGNSLVLGPYAAGSFKFTPNWSAGAEFRLPYYFKGGGLLLNQPYVLTQGQYHF